MIYAPFSPWEARRERLPEALRETPDQVPRCGILWLDVKYLMQVLELRRTGVAKHLIIPGSTIQVVEGVPIDRNRQSGII